MSELKLNPLLQCSLVSLRAFREAARSENLTVAAQHIGVTQSAMSHHIKFLEKQLGVTLFVRRGRKLDLTEDGRVLFEAVNDAFQRLENAIGNIHKKDQKKRLILGVLSSFATKWLVPHLGGFYDTHPDIELVVHSVNHTINVERENIDLALVNLPQPPTSQRVLSRMLWSEKLFPVCSPDYLAAHPIKKIEALRGRVLLHDETEIDSERGVDWHSWLNHHDRADVAADTVAQYFSQSDLVLQAAIAGHGVGLTRTSLAVSDLRSGVLVKPFPGKDMKTQAACYLCGLKELWEMDTSTRFRNWLIAEINSDAALAGEA